MNAVPIILLLRTRKLSFYTSTSRFKLFPIIIVVIIICLTLIAFPSILYVTDVGGK